MRVAIFDRNPRLGTSSRERVESGRALVGRDLAFGTRVRSRSLLLPMLAALLVGSLFLVALRSELIRMRYAMANNLTLEQELLEEQRTLTVQERQLRDPARLAEKAADLGFVRAQQIIDLPQTPAGTSFSLAAEGLPRP